MVLFLIHDQILSNYFNRTNIIIFSENYKTTNKIKIDYSFILKNIYIQNIYKYIDHSRLIKDI